jgi:hypothetical protein
MAILPIPRELRHNKISLNAIALKLHQTGFMAIDHGATVVSSGTGMHISTGYTAERQGN